MYWYDPFKSQSPNQHWFFSMWRSESFSYLSAVNQAYKSRKDGFLIPCYNNRSCGQVRWPLLVQERLWTVLVDWIVPESGVGLAVSWELQAWLASHSEFVLVPLCVTLSRFRRSHVTWSHNPGCFIIRLTQYRSKRLLCIWTGEAEQVLWGPAVYSAGQEFVSSFSCMALSL